MLDLRPYQTRSLADIENAEREGLRRPLVVLPTGTGKTVVFSHALAQRRDRGRGLVLVHREELADQTVKKINMVAPELTTGIVKAERNELDADVVVASVQTASRDRRLAELVASGRRSPFGTIVVDEAHHAPAPTWRKVLEGMGSYSEFGPLTVGFTATPERDNGKNLGVWERVVTYMSIREAIYGDPKRKEEGGYLVPILPAVVVETKMDLGKVRKNGGDYSDGDLGTALEEAGAIEQIADAYAEHARDRKGVAFTPTVATAHHLAAELTKRGIPAEAVDGTTPSDERRAILARLKTGETQVVVNCAVLTEGFDEPSVSCVVVARPTKFHGLYVQMVGRGTRLFPGKTDLMVLDIVGASNRHELIGWVDLGLDVDDPRKKPEGPSEKQACPACGEPCEVPEHRCALCNRYLPARVVSEGRTRHDNCHAGAAGKVDVFGTSRLAWLPLPGGAYCLAAGKEVVVMAPVGSDTWKLAAYENTKLTIIQNELPADWAMGIGEDRAKAFQRLAERSATWRRGRASEAQKSRLLRQGLKPELLAQVKTMGQASDLSTRITGRHALKKMGLPTR
jgi:superfamily II DNA or RNA helicase